MENPNLTRNFNIKTRSVLDFKLPLAWAVSDAEYI